MDHSIPAASHSRSRLEEGAWTGEKEKPNTSSPSTEEKLLIDHKQEQEADLDLDEDTTFKLAIGYYHQLRSGHPDNEDWSEDDEMDFAQLNQRLALYRIKAYELSSTGKELDVEELKEKYPLPFIISKCYFINYEKNFEFEWYFDPELCKYPHLDDYQRLVLYNDLEYIDWDYYRLTYHTYQGDLDYVQYLEEMAKEIKWIGDKVGLDKPQWQKYEGRAFLQAMKMARRFDNIFRTSCMNGFSEYIASLKYDIMNRKDFDGVYLEIWKRVAKQKMDFYDALEELRQQNMFPSRSGDIEHELEKRPSRFFSSMKGKYDTYVASIDEKISEDDAHLLIIEAVQKMFPKQKTYLDYAKKKMEIAARIGLIPKRSSQDIMIQEGSEGC